MNKKLLMPSISIEKMKNLFVKALNDTSKLSEIVDELSYKIQNIKILLSVFKNELSLGLGKNDLTYKIRCLDLLLKLINSLGIPFVRQINDSEFLKDLELSYNNHFVLKERIDMIIKSIGYVIRFEADSLVPEEYYKLLKRIYPNFKWIALNPADGFERTVHKAVGILGLCETINEALMKPPRKEFNLEEQISSAIRNIESLHKLKDVFELDFEPIELEFIDFLIRPIKQFEEKFLSMFKKAPKNIEETLLPKKHSQKSEVSKQSESKQKLHKCTYFVYNEILISDEADFIEYKNYSYPFNEMIETLKKSICSFLNQRGGRIYIGVDDKEKKVYGLTLKSKDRDSLKLDIYYILNDFNPNITHEDFVKVQFLPVCDNTKKAIPGAVVVKIIVKPGDRSKIYSASKSLPQCWIRKDGFCKILDAEQITSFLKNRWNQPIDKKDDPKEFDDPEPDTLAEIEYESAAKKQIKQVQISNQPRDRKEEEKKQKVSPSKKLAHQSDSHDQVVKKKPENKTLAEPLAVLQKNHKLAYGFKLTGLPFDTTEEEIMSFFQGVSLASKPNVIRDKESGDCIGIAFINFYDLETGTKAAKNINGRVNFRKRYPLKMAPQKK